MRITNSLRLTDKHLEFHKRAQGGEFIYASGELKEMWAFVFAYQVLVPPLQAVPFNRNLIYLAKSGPLS